MSDDDGSPSGRLGPPGPDAGKAEWRRWAKEVRADLDWPALSRAVVARLRSFPPLRYASTALIYLPMQEEIDLTHLLDTHPQKRWVATRTPQEGPLTIHELGGPLEEHRFGFRQPMAGAPQVDPSRIDLVFVPGLVFDLYGHRIGHGAGYYDELLTRMRPATVLVGAIPAALVADRVPADDHDVPVDWLAAEEGVVGVAR